MLRAHSSEYKAMQRVMEKLLAQQQHNREHGRGLQLLGRPSPGSVVSPGAHTAVALQQPSAENGAQGLGAPPEAGHRVSPWSSHPVLLETVRDAGHWLLVNNAK